MAVVKSSSSPAAALLLAMLLLFAAASAAVAQQAPPPEEEEEEPGCPADINEIIVDAIKGRQLSAETLAKFDELSTREVFDCVCDNVVDAAGITSASPGAISSLVKDVVDRLGRNSFSTSVGDCNPTLPNTQ